MRLMHGFLAVVALVMLAFSLFPLLAIWLAGGPRVDLLSIVVSLLCPGGVLLPLGGFLFCYSLLLLFGSVEVKLTAAHLIATTRLGFLMGWSSVALHELRGLRIEAGIAGDGKTETQLREHGVDQICSLKADLGENRWRWIAYAYPKPWLTALMAALQEHLDAQGVKIVTETRNLDPTHIEERLERPSESDARLVETAQGIAIHIPPKGFWRGNEPFVIFFTVVWNLIAWPFGIAMLIAAWHGHVAWGDGPEKTSFGFVVLFMTPFWGLGLGLITMLLNNAWSCYRLLLEGSRLTLETTGVFGTHSQQWHAEQLNAVRVGSRSHENDGTTVWTTGLVIEPIQQGESFLLTERPKAELEWLASTIRVHLKLLTPSTEDPTSETAILSREGSATGVAKSQSQFTVSGTPEGNLPRSTASLTKPKSRFAWIWPRLAIGLLLFLVGWEWRTGYDKTGRATSLASGPIFFFAAAPDAKELLEAKDHAGLAVSRWYWAGVYRQSSSVGKTK
jgi:hypothetical protein